MIMFKDNSVNYICGFLTEISLQVQSGTVSVDSFLPGIFVLAGSLIVDEEKLKYPDDLLHEA